MEDDGEVNGLTHHGEEAGGEGGHRGGTDTAPAQPHGANNGYGDVEGRTTPKVSLAPRLGKTPTPTPTVFEWRSDIQRKLVIIDHDVDALKQGGVHTSQTTMNRQPSAELGTHKRVEEQKTFRLSKEYEDEETAFQRTTTKIALDVARAEAERGIQRANMVENMCAKLQERLDGMQRDFEAKSQAQARLQAELQSKVSSAEAEKRVMQSALEELQEDSKAKDKRCNDLEDVVFFLQDEIAKLQQAAAEAAAKKAAAPAGRGRAPAPSPPKVAPVKKKK